MNYNAYWISPDGESIPVTYNHIHAIICQPMRFGLTLETIKEEHIRFNEPLGMKGKARE